MITPQEFKEQWKASPLVRVDDQCIRGIDLPDDAKQFLLQAGLPSRPMFDLYFDQLADGLPKLVTYLKDEFRFPARFDKFYVLGRWKSPDSNYLFHDYVCLEAQSGQIVNVYLVNTTLPDETNLTFCNSSIPQMAACFLVYETLRRSIGQQKSFEEIEASFALHQEKAAAAIQHLAGVELSNNLQQLIDRECASWPGSDATEGWLNASKQAISLIDHKAIENETYLWPNTFIKASV